MREEKKDKKRGKIEIKSKVRIHLALKDGSKNRIEGKKDRGEGNGFCLYKFVIGKPDLGKENEENEERNEGEGKK